MTANQIAVSSVIWAIMARMKAMTVNELGPPEVLRLQSYPDPVPEADQIHVRIHAIGLNFPEFLQIAGKYQHKPELPFVPGLEAAGDVIGIGPDVARYAIGDKVVIHGKTGMYADQAVVSENAAIQLPTPFSYAEGAAFWAAYNTAYVCLVARGRLAAGDRVLIHGAAGGVGLAAVDVAHQIGAEAATLRRALKDRQWKCQLCPASVRKQLHGAPIPLGPQPEVGVAPGSRFRGCFVHLITLGNSSVAGHRP